MNWNIERHAPATWQAQSLLAEIAGLNPDIICLTEAWEGSATALGGHSISSIGVTWSLKHGDERKVLLWSKTEWRDAEVVDVLEKTGSAVSGITELGGHFVRVVGLCVPYSFASPVGQEPRAKPWSQHEEFLEDLAPLLRSWRDAGPTIVIGDFNRFIPRHWGPRRSYALLEAAMEGYEVITAGEIPGVSARAIDHIAIAGDFRALSVFGLAAEAADGRRRSDHFGVVADLEIGSEGT